MTGSGYIEGDSLFYRLDPFIKLMCFSLIFISVLIASDLLSFVMCSCMLILTFILSGVPFGRAFGGILRLWLFFVMIFLMNFAFFSPDTAFYTLWIFSFSFEGMLFGIKTIIRVIFAMVLSNILVSVTTPVEITGALETLIYPLKFIGVPVRDVAMIMGVAVQFIPIFSMEAENIKTAQTARGAAFESGKLTDRAKSYMPLLIPVFLSAFKRADELSIAMESRGYIRRKGRFRLKKRHMHKADILSLILCTAFMGSLILIRYI